MQASTNLEVSSYAELLQFLLFSYYLTLRVSHYYTLEEQKAEGKYEISHRKGENSWSLPYEGNQNGRAEPTSKLQLSKTTYLSWSKFAICRRS